MMPLHPAFRRLLLKYIPQLSSNDLDKCDGLLALIIIINYNMTFRGDTKLAE